MNQLLFLTLTFYIFFACTACGGKQNTEANLDIRPLEEYKASEIIEDVLKQRGYKYQKDIEVQLKTGTEFNADFKIQDHKIAIEYLSEQDVESIENLPPAAEGSRLHVLSARVPPSANQQLPQQVFVFFIHAKDFLYHFNPTPDRRADVTVLEVDSRLRRDMQDFLSWYETRADQR